MGSCLIAIFLTGGGGVRSWPAVVSCLLGSHVPAAVPCPCGSRVPAVVPCPFDPSTGSPWGTCPRAGLAIDSCGVRGNDVAWWAKAGSIIWEILCSKLGVNSTCCKGCHSRLGSGAWSSTWVADTHLTGGGEWAVLAGCGIACGSLGSLLDHKGAAIFIDVEKAFDSVWHNGLRYKLMNTNLPNKIVRLMSSFITDRKISVKKKKRLQTKFHSMPAHLRARFSAHFYS